MTGVRQDGEALGLGPSRVDSRAFTLQFTTLMLIILSFIIGAFGAGRPASSADAEPSPAEADEAAPAGLEGRVASDTIFIEHRSNQHRLKSTVQKRLPSPRF